MDGAMAISYRIDNYGSKMYGYFSDLNSCAPVWGHNWGFYLPAESEIHYVSPEIDNYGDGYDDSAILLRDKTDHDYDGESLVHRVCCDGIKHTGYCYRLYKKNFWGNPTKEKTQWFGGGVYNKAYIQPQVLDAGFVYTEFSLHYSPENIEL